MDFEREYIRTYMFNNAFRPDLTLIRRFGYNDIFTSTTMVRYFDYLERERYGREI